MSKVAVYDSGVGGLTVFSKIRAASPNAELIFISDNEAYPYGTKSEQALLERVSEVGSAILRQCQPDVLVLACNTASTVCLPHLRRQLDIPIVGVVPAIKPAAKETQSKVVGLLATPATVNRSYTDQLIKDFASDCAITKLGSKALVDMAERKLAGVSVDLDLLSSILMPLIEITELDTLILACTHFPLLADEIGAVFTQYNRSVRLIDSGDAVARRVKHLLSSSVNTDNIDHTALFTRHPELPSLMHHLKSLGITRIDHLQL
ncbi:glutamate racemase [Arenicella sp. 4NH20-0111]|uniref:glutamate racemase n=1 Tax=Arenicella sp. 4NH20-0111 TaxID=3127648 RepID=UPI0031029301